MVRLDLLLLMLTQREWFRGYVSNPEVHFQYNSGKLNVGMAVGTDGQLSVTKDLGLKRLLYRASSITNW